MPRSLTSRHTGKELNIKPFSQKRGWQATRDYAKKRQKHRSATAPRRADHHIRLPLIQLGLRDADGGVEVVVGEMGIEDGVAVVPEIGRLQAARSRLEAVEEEDGHGCDV